MRLPIVIIGASGHGRAVADALTGNTAWELTGFIDDKTHGSAKFAGFPVFGPISELPILLRKGTVAAVVLGVGCNFVRERLWQQLRKEIPEIPLPVVVHPHAYVAADAILEQGTVVLAGAIIGPAARVGTCGLVNTVATLDHESHLGPFASLAPGSRTGGNVVIGAKSAIGMGALLKHGIKVGEDTVVGMGSVVTKDVSSGVVAYGAPARIVRNRNKNDPYL